MYKDLRYAFRQLIKMPGFTAVAVLSLALGIATNTTIFSFVNALLLRPPPVEKPPELWQIFRLKPKASSAMEHHGPWSKPSIAYLREHNQSFAALGAFDPEIQFVSWNRNGVGVSAQVQVVTGNFFDLCGIRAERGRAFVPAEDQTPNHYVQRPSLRFPSLFLSVLS
jgi:putative ABC transport system permease protein